MMGNGMACRARRASGGERAHDFEKGWEVGSPGRMNNVVLAPAGFGMDKSKCCCKNENGRGSGMAAKESGGKGGEVARGAIVGRRRNWLANGTE